MKRLNANYKSESEDRFEADGSAEQETEEEDLKLNFRDGDEFREHEKLGGGFSRDGGGRLHLIDARVLY